jgi:hypothetical protein
MKKELSEKERLLDLYCSLEKERKTLMGQWKDEFKDEQKKQHDKRCCNKIQQYMDNKLSQLVSSVKRNLIGLETFVCNLPLTVGAVAIAWVTMGVDWWKYTEEMLSSCTPVHFRSEYCSFPEFPGCFECVDKEDGRYKAALYHHYFCDIFASVLLLGFATKCLLAWEIVADELKNPTTSTPCGLVLITICIIAAGQGPIGEVLVLLVSFVYLLLFGWFFFVAFKYRLLPDPSWGPNTIGICYPAVKTWLYFGVPGELMMGVSAQIFLIRIPVSRHLTPSRDFLVFRPCSSVCLVLWLHFQSGKCSRETNVEEGLCATISHSSHC